jgi:CBS domain-containing protein
MSRVKQKKVMSGVDAGSFLKTVRPFSDLGDDQFKRIAKKLTEAFYPEGTVILSQGLTEVNALHLIKSGGVKIYLKDEEDAEVLQEYRGPGDYFGALGIIMDTRANLFVESAEDTHCVLIPRKDFETLLETDPVVCLFFLRSFCGRYIHSAHFELQKKDDWSRTDGGGLFLFSQDVGSVIKAKLHTCLSTDTAREAAAKMAEFGIGSLLVKGDDGKIEGIITDKDLRTKVVAKGLDCDEPVRSIMSSPVQTAPSEAVCFDALFSMLKNRIHHLGVRRNDEIVGMITAHDILLLQGASPIFLFREIASQTEIERLFHIPKKIPGVVRRLIEEGARASNVNRLITVLNDQILERILTLLIKEMGTPPVPFCWMVMGSEGRKEQTFKTDQDNAIVFEDVEGKTDQEKTQIRQYFLSLADEAVHHLAACGYALCKGNIMASNPDWTQSLSVWKGLFDRWVFSPDPEEVLKSTIFFDFRPAFGKAELAFTLREHLLRKTMQEKLFIHHLAKDCVSNRAPLSLLKKFVVNKGGKYKGRLDLKTKGLTPFVDFARLMCLSNGLRPTNTLERIQALSEHKALSDEFANRIVESYEFQMQLRIVHQLQNMGAGKEPDNCIDPSELSDIERLTLKKAFQVIDDVRSFLANYFHLNLG